MILYSFMNTYQLLECIEHKLLFHENEYAVLLLYPFVLDKVPHYRQLVKMGIFDEVCLFDSGKINYNSKTLIEDIEKEMKACLSVAIEDIDSFFLTGAHMPITVYLMENGIEFIIAEEGSGAYSRPELLDSIERSSYRAKYEIVSRYSLYDLTKLTDRYDKVKEIFCDFSGQREGFEERDILHNFNLCEQFSRLPEERKVQVLNFFGCPENVNYPEDSILILTQQFANLNQTDFEGQVMIYQVFTDVFAAKKHLVFKVHPDDIMYYQQLFPSARIIRQKFPCELLPFTGNTLPPMIGTITSSSMHVFTNYDMPKIYFEADYEKMYGFTFRYYLAHKILATLGITDVDEKNTVKRLLYNLKKFSDVSVAESNNIYKAIVADDIWEEEASVFKKIAFYQSMEECAEDGSIIIFINSSERYFFYTYERKELYKNIVPVCIRKNKIREENNYFSVKEEYIYIYSKNQKLRESIRHMEEYKVLEHCGLELSIQDMTEEQYRIKVLEGQLRATEQRLLDYIRREKERESL